MQQPLVLAIEPDLRQAAIVKRIVREKVMADVAVVDSRDAALEAIRTAVPDVLLLSTLLSPRDEDELIAHLRTLDQAQHLQTHTIPRLASSIGDGESRESRGLLSAFRRKKTEIVPSGCDPDLFAEEIKSYLRQASEKKRELRELAEAGHAPAINPATAAPGPAPAAPPPDAAEPQASGSSWSSPFEWRPAGTGAAVAPTPSSVTPDPPIAKPEPFVPDPEPDYIEPRYVEPVHYAPASSAEPEFAGPELEVQRERLPLETVNMWHDAGFAMRDQGLAISDSILSGRSVPVDIAAIAYASGCRVRRVRVASAAA